MEKVTVITTTYNRAELLKEAIASVLAQTFRDWKLLIIDDGSTDGTRDLLKGLTDTNIRKYFHEVNQGKGAALRTGFKQAAGDVVVVQDADLEYDPEDYHRLLKPIVEGRADVVYGSRFLTSQEHRVLLFWHSMGNRLLTFVSNMFTNLNMTDIETCYKMFRAEIIQGITIEEDRFGFEPEITAKVAKRRCRIYEIGISYSGRDYSEGKKIGWKDGVSALFTIVRYWLFE